MEKPHFNVDLPESFTSGQIQCIPGSNTGTGEVNLSQLFNNTPQNNTSSILMTEQLSKINNTSLSVGLSGINLNDNYVCTEYSSMNNEEDDGLKSDSSILSIAMNINEEDLNMKFADDFENDDVNNVNNVVQPNSFVVAQNTDTTHKQEEEYQIKTSLKLLENLVNIEHNKLEVQKTLAEKELLHNNIESNEKNPCKILNKTNFRKKDRSLKTPNQNIDGELLPKYSEQRKHNLKKQTEPKRKCFYQSKIIREISKNLKNQINCNTTFLSDLSTKVQIDRIYSMYNTNSKSKSTSTNIESITPNETLSSVKLKEYSDKIENISTNEIEGTNATTTGLLIKTNPIASTSRYNENDEDVLNNKSPSASSLAKTTKEYKKIYEIDRKSLFSPDIIVGSKPIKKEDRLIKTNDNKCVSNKKSKTKRNILTAKRKIVKDNHITVKITNNKDKIVNLNDTVSKDTCDFAIPKYPPSVIHVKHYKTKKSKEHDSLAERSTDSNNKNEELNTDILKNEELNRSTIIENQEPSNEQIIENQESNNEQLLLENQGLNIDSPENNSLPEWIKKLFKYHSIKPIYVVVEKNKSY